MRILFTLLGAFFLKICFGQSPKDTITPAVLPPVYVKAYEQNRRLMEVPAPVNQFGQSELNRFSNVSIVGALNTAPGIRMEERSPGSYRLNLRGSSLRSPFGVRNVKVYYNGIPLTDPGGTTYLNQLGFYNYGAVEIIKGPGSSLYGSGTGGVMLIDSKGADSTQWLQADYTAGSYGLSNVHLAVQSNSNGFYNKVAYQQLSSQGYRQHSALSRKVLSWDAETRLAGGGVLSGHFLYSDLWYQTPGALTATEFRANPAASRPPVGTVPGSAQAQAAVNQRSFIAGLTLQQPLGNNWQHTTVLYGAFNRLHNPTIRNYSKNNEPHAGGRTVFQYKKEYKNGTQLSWHTGAELQQGFGVVQVYGNRGGNPDTLQSDEEIANTQWLLFTQLSAYYKSWQLTGGISYNGLQVDYLRAGSGSFSRSRVEFTNQLAPRIALLRQLGSYVSFWASWARGFSPPTTAELAPSGGVLNPLLKAEWGSNSEIGFRAEAFQRRLYIDVNAFYFALSNTIVQRRDSAGGDYFLNAGATRQRGVETAFTYWLSGSHAQWFRLSKVWLSHTWYWFNYHNFKQVDISFSGNRLPGVPRHTVVAGLDMHFTRNIYTNVTYQYNGRLPLNDANNAFADRYHLVDGRLGFKKMIVKKMELHLFAGINNLLNQTYSLGNDLNAFGGRYYNAAPLRNFFTGVSLGFAAP